MTESDSVRMTEEESIEFLGRGGTGVISFATDADEAPYSLPVSYGFSEALEAFYYRLAFPSDGGKGDVLDRPVSFVTHRDTADGWRSVIATGELEEVSEADYESAEVQGMWEVEIPLVEIFEREADDVTFRYFRLDPAQLTGRKERPTDP